jgi:hypothetical protein
MTQMTTTIDGLIEGSQVQLAAMGVGWRVVPPTGHAMGLQKPKGLAQTIAEVVGTSWRR